MENSVLAAMACVCIFAIGCTPQVEEFSASSPMIKTQVGVNTGKGIETSGNGGFWVFGPYVSLRPGVYRIDIDGYLDGAEPSLGIFDVVSEKGARIHLSFPVYRNMASADGSVMARAYFSIQKEVNDAEFRVLVAPGAKGVFHKYVLRRISDLPND